MHYGVEGLLLTALGGYFVVERSAAQKGRVRKIGRFVGGLVIIVSFLGVACRVWCLAAGTKGYCPVHKSGKGWYHHDGGKALPGGSGERAAP